METKNLLELLQIIGFEKDGGDNDVYLKKYANNNQHVITVNIHGKQINYNAGGRQKIGIGDLTTSNTSKPENLVVLECVDALLELGYQPQHIALEKRWNLGHTAKGGKADICVYNATGDKIFIIIECKANHDLFEEELARMQSDDAKTYGSQLFSYWQQERSTKWLALYTSSIKSNKLAREISCISCEDSEMAKEMAAQDDTIPLYRKATDVASLHRAWKETYHGHLYGDVIFQNSAAYQIDVHPIRKKDLIDFSIEDNIVEKFSEILRHNNISDKGNAFNKLMALFICKLVDELEKDQNSEMAFQSKAGQTYEDLQDLLQRLHQIGMKRFMREDIYYIDEERWAEGMLETYVGYKRPEFLNALKAALRETKYYTNNDFAFKEVHNEELFKQNGKVLVEVVRLFQKFRIIGSQNLQFLGTLFENLLNKGFKQDEGQFFTPVPIAHFIWDSLPLHKIIKQEGNRIQYPKIIDYSCGAGHFLTEGISAVNDHMAMVDANRADNRDWVSEHIYGIEKDYRLARVSKIALFMHGAGKGNIILGDGLENYPDKGVDKESFDILVANPPYSVEGFKEHLPKHLIEQLTISQHQSAKASDIETLFVERISQLLKPKGIAAVILPETFLTKKLRSFIEARKLLLRDFSIKAIVKLGKHTFGATQALTVILFLQKYDSPPNSTKLAKDAVTSILDKESTEDWTDKDIFIDYLANINVDLDIYSDFITESKEPHYWESIPYFQDYYQELTRNGNISKDNFYKKIKDREREKLHYFALTYNQNILVIESPKDIEDEKNFLGYEWKKGELQGRESAHKLYDETNRLADDCLASLIRYQFVDPCGSAQAFSAKTEQGTGGDEEQKFGAPEGIAFYEQYYYYLNLPDILSFKTVQKGEIFSAFFNVSRNTEYESKYPAREMFRLLKRIDDTSIKVAKHDVLKQGRFPVIAQETARFISGYTDLQNPIKDVPLVLFGDHSCCFKYIDKPFFRGADGTQLLKTDESVCRLKYLYYFLSNMQVRNAGHYERHFKYLKVMPIPLPPVKEQDKLIGEFDKLMDRVNEVDKNICAYDDDIMKSYQKLKKSAVVTQTLAQVATMRKGDILTKKMAAQGDVPVIGAGMEPSCTHNVANRPACITTVSSSGANAGYVAWWDVPIFATDCTTVEVNEQFRDKLLNIYLYYALKERQDELFDMQTGAEQPHVYSTDFANYEIKIPPLDLQKDFAKYVDSISALKKKQIALKNDLDSQKLPLLNKYLK